MDLTESTRAKSDQLDAVDLVLGEQTFTVERVSRGDGDQPVNVHVAEFPRPWRPNVNMRRVLVSLWGKESDTWTGHRVTLFCDQSVKFGAETVGGIRIRAMSHIGGRKQQALIMPTRGKNAYYTVSPLPDDAPRPEPIQPDTLTELGALFASKGIPAEQRLAGVSRAIGAEVTDLEALTEQQAQQIIDTLRNRPDKETQQ